MMHVIICGSWILEIADWTDIATVGTSHLVSVIPCIIGQIPNWANNEVEANANDKMP